MNEQTAGIGHNNPPEDEPQTPFDICKSEIDDLLLEAGNWLDGAQIEGQLQADGLATLIDKLGKAWDKAEAERRAEKKPFDDGAKAVQAKWKPTLLDKVERAITVGKSAQTKWLRKLKLAQEDAARAAAKLASDAAAAAAAARVATDTGDLAAREAAEEKIDDAMSLVDTAKMLGGLKAQAKGEGASRAMGLRSSWVVTLNERGTLGADGKPNDATAALRHYWSNPDRRAEIEALALDMAKKDVRAGARHIPGFTITEEFNA